MAEGVGGQLLIPRINFSFKALQSLLYVATIVPYVLPFHLNDLHSQMH